MQRDIEQSLSGKRRAHSTKDAVRGLLNLVLLAAAIVAIVLLVKLVL